jgi:peptide/nickel transport system permease protein
MTFLSYVLKRCLQAIPTIVAVIAFSFLLIHIAPGDPALRFVSHAGVTEEYLNAIREKMGLNKPLYAQFLIYFTNLLKGDFGYSTFYRSPVLPTIMEALSRTILIMGFGLGVAVLIGIPIGVEAARRPHTKWDYLATSFSVAGYSIPVYWLGLIMIIIFAVYLRIFPSGGMWAPGTTPTGLKGAIDIMHHMILPGVTLAASQLALISRLARQSTIESLSESYILTARMKGLDEHVITYRHAFRNAILPVVTMIGLQIGIFVSWSVLTEMVFSWPGIGLLLYQSLMSRDYPMLMGIFIIISIMVIVSNLATDVAYAKLDPRIVYK